MKFKSVPKTKKEIIEKVKANLPRGWSLDHISDDKRWFFVNVPIKQHFSDDLKVRKAEKAIIRKLEKATGFTNNGGGFLVGGSRYTLDFYFG